MCVCVIVIFKRLLRVVLIRFLDVYEQSLFLRLLFCMSSQSLGQSRAPGDRNGSELTQCLAEWFKLDQLGQGQKRGQIEEGEGSEVGVCQERRDFQHFWCLMRRCKG